MVLTKISDAEAAAHLQKFLANVDEKDKMDFDHCCGYIDKHWNEFFTDEKG